MGILGWLLFGATLGAQETRVKWSFAVGGSGGVSSSAAISPDGNTVYVGVEAGTFGRVVAIDINNLSKEKWKFDRPEAFNSSPTVGPDGTVYIGCEDGKFYALNGETGAKLWEVDTGTNGFVDSSPAIGSDGTIYFGAGDSRLHAVSSQGRELWTFPTGSFVDSSPAIGPDGTVYFGSYDRKVYAITPTATQGILKWTFSTAGEVQSSPAIGADGTVYIGANDNRLYALSPVDGTKKWEFPVNGIVYASPVLGADGTIYLGADTNFYAVNPDGSLKWKKEIGATTASTAAVRGDGVIVFGADDRRVHFLNPDGTERAAFDNGVDKDIFEASPLIGPDGTVYIGSLESGRFYALSGGGSPLSTYSSWPAFRRDARHTARALTTEGGQLINISARAQVSGQEALITGVVIGGTSEKVFLIRGVGPTLSQFGVTNPMPDPRLEIFVKNTSIARNDNWEETIAASFGVAETSDAVKAFPLPAGSKDAAIVPVLSPGVYTVHVSAADGQGGVALAEVYDVRNVGDRNGRILNLSTRGQVGTNGNVLIPGVVVGGTGAVRLLVRGIGPGLAQFGVGGVLARPTITVFSEAGQPLGSNTGWMSDGFVNDLTFVSERVGAFPLAANSADCALILTATPGNYTIQVAGVNGTTGVALVEIYVLP